MVIEGSQVPGLLLVLCRQSYLGAHGHSVQQACAHPPPLRDISRGCSSQSQAAA